MNNKDDGDSYRNDLGMAPTNYIKRAQREKKEVKKLIKKIKKDIKRENKRKDK